MASRSYALLCMLAGLAAWAVPAEACKYSVRDVAFVSLGDAPYRLYLLLDESTGADTRGHLEVAAPATLLDANIVHEIVHVEQQAEHTASRLAKSMGLELPALLFLAADDRTLSLPLCDDQGSHTEDSVWDALRAVVTSSARSEIMEHCLIHHSIVLLIEGSDRDAARRARGI